MKTETHCSKCGSEFKPSGVGTGYARLSDDSRVCYACADDMQRAELLDRSRSVVAYLSSDGTRVTTWSGGQLGNARNVGSVRLTRRSYVHGATMNSYRVTDVHGGQWYGRGSPGIAIVLRPCKEPKTAVVFRAFKDDGAIIALFPYVAEDRRGWRYACGSYMHVGQHGVAEYSEVVQMTRPAKPEEYASLKRELESAPYRYKLRVIARRAAK